MNVRVWSPHAGIPVRLKVEDKMMVRIAAKQKQR
jgi:hypothetical protein